MSAEQFGIVRHSRWLESDEPLATVIRSSDGWAWHDMCVTDPDTAEEIADALTYTEQDRGKGAMAEFSPLVVVSDALRAVADEQYDEIMRLRMAGDALAVAYRKLGGLDVAFDREIAAWEQARHERP